LKSKKSTKPRLATIRRTRAIRRGQKTRSEVKIGPKVKLELCKTSKKKSSEG